MGDLYFFLLFLIHSFYLTCGCSSELLPPFLAIYGCGPALARRARARKATDQSYRQQPPCPSQLLCHSPCWCPCWPPSGQPSLTQPCLAKQQSRAITRQLLDQTILSLLRRGPKEGCFADRRMLLSYLLCCPPSDAQPCLAYLAPRSRNCCKLPEVARVVATAQPSLAQPPVGRQGKARQDRQLTVVVLPLPCLPTGGQARAPKEESNLQQQGSGGSQQGKARLGVRRRAPARVRRQLTTSFVKQKSSKSQLKKLFFFLFENLNFKIKNLIF